MRRPTLGSLAARARYLKARPAPAAAKTDKAKTRLNAEAEARLQVRREAREARRETEGASQ